MTYVVACFISDRQDLYLPECQKSFWRNVPSGSIKYWNVIDDRDHVLGMAGAVAKAWAWAREIDADYLWHQEEDFLFLRNIPLQQMMRVLELNPHLGQCVLKREPWSPEEMAAGGQMELCETRGDTMTECFAGDLHWVEHDTLFSVNPCLIPRKVLETVDPTSGTEGVERTITDQCHTQGWRFAYYGKKTDPPRCEHVGHVRAGAGWRW